MQQSTINMAKRQAPLAEQYSNQPLSAMVTDSASCKQQSSSLCDPLHSSVTIGNLTIPVAVHKAVGGQGDGPVPGDILCAALASCLDSSLQIIANRLHLSLLKLDINVTGNVDVRGTLCLDPNVPIGFQSMHVSALIEVPPETNIKIVNALWQSVERSCVILQTLQRAMEVSTQFQSNIHH